MLAWRMKHLARLAVIATSKAELVQTVTVQKLSYKSQAIEITCVPFCLVVFEVTMSFRPVIQTLTMEF